MDIKGDVLLEFPLIKWDLNIVVIFGHVRQFSVMFLLNKIFVPQAVFEIIGI